MSGVARFGRIVGKTFEPTGNLDTSSGADVLSVLGELWDQGGTLMAVTHDPALAKRAQRVVELKDGRIVRD